MIRSCNATVTFTNDVLIRLKIFTFNYVMTIFNIRNSYLNIQRDMY
jgi:hypothetical protein